MGKQISYRFTLHFCTTFLFLFFIRFHSIHVYSFVLLSYINIYTNIQVRIVLFNREAFNFQCFSVLHLSIQSESQPPSLLPKNSTF